MDDRRSRPRCTVRGCGKIGHTEQRCWVAHPELKPQYIKDREKRKQQRRADTFNIGSGQGNQQTKNPPSQAVATAATDSNASRSRGVEVTRKDKTPKHSATDIDSLLWRKPLYIYSRLPLALRHEVHKYTLTTKNAVYIEASEKDHLKYQWREPS